MGILISWFVHAIWACQSNLHNRVTLVKHNLSLSVQLAWPACHDALILVPPGATERSKQHSQCVLTNACKPPFSQHMRCRHMGLAAKIFAFVGPLFMKSIPQGAATTVYAATAPELEGKSGEPQKSL